jgi:hypothetical protein
VEGWPHILHLWGKTILLACGMTRLWRASGRVPLLACWRLPLQRQAAIAPQCHIDSPLQHRDVLAVGGQRLPRQGGGSFKGVARAVEFILRGRVCSHFRGGRLARLPSLAAGQLWRSALGLMPAFNTGIMARAPLPCSVRACLAEPPAASHITMALYGIWKDIRRNLWAYRGSFVGCAFFAAASRRA